jgi:type III pantothenate kinase
VSMAVSCLQMDVGNSSAKWRLIVDGHIQQRGIYVHEDADSQLALLDCASDIEQIWVSSVASPAAESQLTVLLQQRWGVKPWFARSAAVTGGMRNSYEQPQRMGVDRWLAMLAGWRRTQSRVCVVDAGSALTIDLVSASGQHEGGYIIPGPALMERALFLDTDRVRFGEEVGYSLLPGQSTAEAVRHGVALAQAGAVQLALTRCAGEAPDLLFCGGGGEQLAGMLDTGGEFVGDLVFEGLEQMAEDVLG